MIHQKIITEDWERRLVTDYARPMFSPKHQGKSTIMGSGAYTEHHNVQGILKRSRLANKNGNVAKVQKSKQPGYEMTQMSA